MIEEIPATGVTGFHNFQKLAFACSRGTDLRLCPSGDQSFYRIDLRRSRVGEGGVGDWPANSLCSAAILD
jgi:hypothetical protein